MTKLKEGDRVRWNTPQGETEGTVVELRYSDFQFSNQKFKASRDDPAYIVQSDKSGKKAAHQSDALEKI